MGLAAISAIAILFLTTDVKSWVSNDNMNITGHRFLGDASFSRFDANFNNENNASLYLPRFGKRSDDTDSSTVVPANETSGRSLDLDALLRGSASSTEERHSDERESRIINDGPKHEIQGFIPIISLKQQAPRHPPPPPPIPHPGFPQPQFDSYESMSHAVHQQQPLYPSYEAPKGVFGGLGAAIQSLKMKRKQGYDQQDMVPGRDCLCVPFYMCKNGFLETTAKNAPPHFLQQQTQQSPSSSQSMYNSLSGSSKEYFDQQVAAAQAELTANIPPNFNPFNQMNGQQSSSSSSQRNTHFQQNPQSSQSYPQPVYDSSNLDQNLPLDERSIDPPSEQGRSTHFPSNETDVSYSYLIITRPFTHTLIILQSSESARQYSPHESRMLGMGNNACGVLRTCCRFAPEFSTGPILNQRPVHQMNGYGQSGFVPQTYQPIPQPPVPQSPFFRPPTGLKRPLIPGGGSFELLSASLLKPKSTSYGQPAYGTMQSSVFNMNNKPFMKPPTRRLIGPSFGPNFQTQRAINSQFQSIPQPLPSFAHNSIGHMQPSSVSYGQCGARSAVSTQGRVQNLQYPEATAEFGEYPWQAALLKRIGPQDSLYVCGGVLISPNFILTAAHCIKENRAEDLKVRLGEWDVHRDDEFYPYVERFVQEIIIHPEFLPGNLNNDIALIRFESPVDLSSSPHIAAACMPESYDSFVGQRCWVTGWGKNSFGHQGEYQSVLREVDLPVMSNDVCEHSLRSTRLGPYYQLFPGFLCAGGERGKDACEGDGGSPLVCEVNGGFKVAGLVSWGIGCGTPGVPGVYASVAYYRQWIDSIVSRYGRSLTSESFENNSYAPAGIIQERSNNSNDTIIGPTEREARSLNLETSGASSSTTAAQTETTVSPMLPTAAA